jgi:AAA+ ATPase superfamily predicted ATPase
MIPCNSTLERFVKSRQNFFLYGPRASGKTSTLKGVFNNAKVDYIYINCTMGDKKVNFFRYLNHEMHKFFKNKFKKHKPNLLSVLTKKKDPTTVHGWLENMKDLILDERIYLKNVYFFIDNIE